MEQLRPFLELLVVDDARVEGVEFDEAGDVHPVSPRHPERQRADLLSLTGPLAALRMSRPEARQPPACV